MGAGASVGVQKLDKSQVMDIAGDSFDEALFDEHKDSEGFISVEMLLGAVESMPGVRINFTQAKLLIGEDNIHEELFGLLKDGDGNITVKQLIAAAKGELLLAGGSVAPVEGPVSDADARRSCMLDGHFLQYCSEEQRNDKGLCVTAVTNVGSALKFCSPTLQDNTTLVKMALKADGTNISFASPRLQGDSECVELALKGLPSFSMKWEAVQLAAKIYAKDHQALKDAPLSLRGDVEVIKVVVQVDGLGIKHAMPMVRHERDVVLLAMKQNMQAIFYASPVALVDPAHDDYKVAPLDPAVLAEAEALWTAQDPAAANASEAKWCPDADSVAKGIERFPELSKFSPPKEWLDTCAERAAKEKEAAEARKEAILKARDEEEKKDAVWSAGLHAPAADAAAPVEERKEGESKEEESKE